MPLPTSFKDRNDKKRIATSKRVRSFRNRAIVKKRMEGKSTAQITKELNAKGIVIAHSTVREILGRDDVKKMLDEEYLKLATSVPKATQNIINAVDRFDDIQSKEKTQISWEATKLIAQAHGLLPTSNQSVIHQTYIQNQHNTLIPPIIAELARKHFGGLLKIPDGGKDALDCTEFQEKAQQEVEYKQGE